VIPRAHWMRSLRGSLDVIIPAVVTSVAIYLFLMADGPFIVLTGLLGAP
jgi:hypothetical protein